MSAPTSEDALGPSERVQWELPEVMGLGLLGAAGVVVVVSVASAVVGAFNVPSGLNGGVGNIGPSISDIISRATEWATIYFPLLLLAVLGMVWWQVQGWIQVADDAEESDEGYRAAFEHLLRARLLDNSAIVVLCILIAAAITGVVAFLVNNANIPDAVGTTLIANDISVIGLALATCLIAGVAAWAGLRLRTSVDEAFVRAEDEGDMVDLT